MSAADYQREPARAEMSSGVQVYNSSPKPFVRQQEANNQHYYIQSLPNSNTKVFDSERRQQAPKIMLNDRLYPTSTVHKSMLNSQRSSASNSEVQSARSNDNNINYSRLISPTVMTASYEESSLSPTIARDTSTSRNSSEESASNNQKRHELLIEIRRPAQTAHNCQEASEGRGATQSMLVNGGFQKTLPISSAQRQAANIDSNTVLPDSKRDEYMWDRQIERVSIAHQTYRTLPIVLPKPKAHHDLASGNYMRLMQDPTWDLIRSRSSSVASKDHERKIQLAIGKDEVSWLFFIPLFSFVGLQEARVCSKPADATPFARSLRLPFFSLALE